jgi:hypothetical protein
MVAISLLPELTWLFAARREGFETPDRSAASAVVLVQTWLRRFTRARDYQITLGFAT